MATKAASPSPWTEAIERVEMSLPSLTLVSMPFPCHQLDPITDLVHANALDWLAVVPESSIHAVVTDPPYGLKEYDPDDLAKLRRGVGGGWRIPPTLDGVQRRPVPRFTTLTEADRRRMEAFFGTMATLLLRALLPGGHLMLASQPLVCARVFTAIEKAGFENRGMIVRRVQTLRGGDRPKGHEREFANVTVMPRGACEPWGLFRKPLSERTVAQNLRKHGTGALRRLSADRPFTDLIPSYPTPRRERAIVDHPSLKPQALMRQLVRAAIPMDEGRLLDPFAGGGATLAAASAQNIHSIGIERDQEYLWAARNGFAGLRDLEVTV